MFPQLSFAEILLVLIVAVVFIRPDDWPRFLRLVGRLYGQVHAYLLRAQDYSRQTFTEITQLDEPPPPATPTPPAAASPPALAAGPAAPAAGSVPPPAATPATEPQEDASAK